VILQRDLFLKKVAILASYDKLPKMGQCNAAMLCTIIKSQVQIVKDAKLGK
jgi:hypothetical protein